MLRFRPFLSLVACGWFGIACIVPASAQVKDAGGFFSADAVAKADAKIQEIDRQFNKSILVESVSEIPNDLKPRYEEQGKAKFFSQWAAECVKRRVSRAFMSFSASSPRTCKSRLTGRRASGASRSATAINW